MYGHTDRGKDILTAEPTLVVVINKSREAFKLVGVGRAFEISSRLSWSTPEVRVTTKRRRQTPEVSASVEGKKQGRIRHINCQTPEERASVEGKARPFTPHQLPDAGSEG